MEVRLLIHAESTDSGLVWWTESPDVPGFTGTGEHLLDAQIRAELAIREILSNKGVEDVSFIYQLVGPGEPSQGPEIELMGDAHGARGGTGGRPVTVAPAA